MADSSGFCEAILGMEFIGKNYIFVHQLDKGEFGQIWVGKDVRTNEQVAIKQMSLKKRNNYNIELIQRELKIMETLEQNDHVISFKDKVYQNDSLYIIMELCQQNLHQKISNIRKMKPNKIALTEDEAITYMWQILDGFKSLRKQGIIHRDIKLKNILVTKNNVLKIADFGLAIKETHAKSMVGTPYTKAPEVYEGLKKYTDKADIWSLGIIFYQMLFDLNYPFPAKDEKELQQKIKSGGINYNFENIEISNQTRLLLGQMLEKNPDRRISWDELFSHPFFNLETPPTQKPREKHQRNNSTSFYDPQPIQVAQNKFKSQSVYKEPIEKTRASYSPSRQGKINSLETDQSQQSSQISIISNEQKLSHYRKIACFISETLINTFLLNRIDPNLEKNQEIQKFCSGSQFELCLLLKHMKENNFLDPKVAELFDFYTEASLNIVSFLSEPRKLQEINTYTYSKFIKCLKKYFNCLTTYAKFVFENMTTSHKPFQILDHSLDILRCSIYSDELNPEKLNTPQTPPKEDDNYSYLKSSRFLTYHTNLLNHSRQIFQ